VCSQLIRRRKGNLSMESAQTYRVFAWWSSGKAGLVKSDSAPNTIHFTAPPGVWRAGRKMDTRRSAALRRCQLLHDHFRALADYSKLEYADLGVEVEGTVGKVDSGYAFTEMVIRTLTISADRTRRPLFAYCRRPGLYVWYRTRFRSNRSLNRSCK
jgi:hypothetical protein